MGFADSVKAFQTKALVAVDSGVEKVIDKLMISNSGVIKTTPILDGILINSWFPMLGGNYDMSISKSESTSGDESIARVKEMMLTKPFHGKDNTVTFTNSQDYAYKIEYLGHSRLKAPQGWVRIAIKNTTGE